MARTYGTLGGMVKTTIYLPEGLDLRLEARAGSTGTSKAELVRRAVARLLDDEAAGDGDHLELPVYSSGGQLTPDDMDREIAQHIAERAARR